MSRNAGCSVCPHLCIVESHIRGMISVVSKQPNLPVGERAIVRTCNFLFIHIDTQCTTLRYNSDRIRLIQASRNSFRRTTCQFLDIISGKIKIAREKVASILAHFKEVQFASVTIVAEDHASTITLYNLRLNFKSEITIIGDPCTTDVELFFLCA